MADVLYQESSVLVLPSLAHEVCMGGWLDPLERPASFLFQLTVAAAAASSRKAAPDVCPPLTAVAFCLPTL